MAIIHQTPKRIMDEVQTPMSVSTIQFVSDENGIHTAVIVPIELWREIESERETAYLLKSARMKQRLLDAKSRDTGIQLEEACAKLGI